MERFGLYNFQISKIDQGWLYEITNDDSTIVRKSNETFQYEGVARFAAIGHISLLEQGKG